MLIYRAGVANSEHIEELGKKVLIAKIGARTVFYFPTLRWVPWFLVLETQQLHLPTPPEFQGTLNVYGKIS